MKALGVVAHRHKQVSTLSTQVSMLVTQTQNKSYIVRI